MGTPWTALGGDRGPGRNRRPGAGKRAQSSPISASSTCQHDIGSHLRQLPRHRPRPRDITAGQTILDALSISLLGSTRSEERSAWVPRSLDAAHPMVPRGWNGGPAHPGHRWPEYPATGRPRRSTVSRTSPSRGIALPEEPGPWDPVAVARRPYGSGCPRPQAIAASSDDRVTPRSRIDAGHAAVNIVAAGTITTVSLPARPGQAVRSPSRRAPCAVSSSSGNKALPRELRANADDRNLRHVSGFRVQRDGTRTNARSGGGAPPSHRRPAAAPALPGDHLAERLDEPPLRCVL